MRNLLWIAAAAGLALLLASSPQAQDTKEPSDDAEGIRERNAAFIAAFDKGDAKAISEFWTPDGDYTDELGHYYKGRKAIQQSFEKLFEAAKGAQMKVHPMSRRLIRPDVAIGDGYYEVVPPGGLPTSTRYTTVQVKQDGRWLLESVRESPYLPPSQEDKLDELAWLIGTWVDESEKGPGLRLSFSWAENQNFIVGSYINTEQNVAVSGATQWIGWDAAEKKIRSWSFDSSGGFSEATWTKDGNRRISKTTKTLRDGKKMVARNILTRVDADHLTFQSTDRSLEGEELPGTPVVKLKRLAEE